MSTQTQLALRVLLTSLLVHLVSRKAVVGSYALASSGRPWVVQLTWLAIYVHYLSYAGAVASAFSLIWGG